jgi:glycerol kinase
MVSHQGAHAKYVGAIDQGTSSTRFILFEAATGAAKYNHQVELTQINYQDAKRSGWAEHDPVEIMQTVQTCITETLKKAGIKPGEAASQIASVGITNQRETTVVWDKQTGKPLHNALVWHDTRTADLVNKIIDDKGNGDKDFLRPVSTAARMRHPAGAV